MSVPYLVFASVMTAMTTPYLRFSSRNDEKSKENKGFKIALLFIAYTVYIVFSVFKKIDLGIGATDAYYYREYYLEISGGLFSYVKNCTQFEPGYAVITWIFSRITDNYYVMLFFWYTLTFISFIHFIKELELTDYVYHMTFIMFMLIINQFYIMRMVVSISVSLFVMLSLRKNQWIKSFLLAILAMSIHISAVILIPVWFTVLILSNTSRLKGFKLTAIVIIGAVCSTTALLFAERIISRTGRNLYLGQSSLAIGTYCAVILFAVIAFLQRKRLDEYNRIYTVLLFALPICLICAPLQYRISVMYRLTLFFLPVIYALISGILSVTAKKYETFYYWIARVTGYGYLIIRVYSICVNDMGSIGPYSNILFS